MCSSESESRRHAWKHAAMILPRRTRRFEHRSDWKQRVEPEKGKRAGKVKLGRAQGGCLGTGSRRRAQRSAKSHGEPPCFGPLFAQRRLRPRPDDVFDREVVAVQRNLSGVGIDQEMCIRDSSWVRACLRCKARSTGAPRRTDPRLPTVSCGGSPPGLPW